MMLVTLSTCNLNQWALDYEGNTQRIIESIIEAKKHGSTLRVGPELEICGYDCLDHFLENDLYYHCWQMMYQILTNEACNNILLDIGMPVMHRNDRFNARVLALNGKIMFIRPKLYLAADGNYRENRYFAPWRGRRIVEAYTLPPMLQKLQGAREVPIGDAVISTPDTCFGAETCEELFTPMAPHIDMGLNGVEVLTNSSGSHHSLRKLNVRVGLICDATRKSGGVYLYSNSRGGGGERLYYDGCSMIVVNGQIVAQGSQFSLKDVEVVTATVDLEEVRAYRAAPSRSMQANEVPRYPRILTDFSLSKDLHTISPTECRKPRYHRSEEEIALGPACFLWDYLRRSGAAGFLLPLSGGIDSCATAVIVHSMCRMVFKEIKENNQQVIADVKRLTRFADETPKTPEELCNQIFYTIYMGMKNQSSPETRQRAKDLSQAIGSMHHDINIDTVFEASKSLFASSTEFTPKFKVHGGSTAENLALQNIQARLRMVEAYKFAQLLPTVRWGANGENSKHAPADGDGKPLGSPGSLLVLGSSNVDECLRGYLTKYDCSSADINPIGSVSKSDLIRFIRWAVKSFNIPVLSQFLTAVPTAELEPITDNYVQSDEADMGFTYDELSALGILRKELKLGPYYMFQKLVRDWAPKNDWSDNPAVHKIGLADEEVDETKTRPEKQKRIHSMEPAEVAHKVKQFYHFYAINRHKATVATPAVHLEGYSCDDNRFDHRPFLYPRMWDNLSYKMIDEEVERITEARKREARWANGKPDA